MEGTDEEEPAPIVMANPVILERSDEMRMHEEGCLSIPDQYADVTRPAEVEDPVGILLPLVITWR